MTFVLSEEKGNLSSLSTYLAWHLMAACCIIGIWIAAHWHDIDQAVLWVPVVQCSQIATSNENVAKDESNWNLTRRTVSQPLERTPRVGRWFFHEDIWSCRPRKEILFQYWSSIRRGAEARNNRCSVDSNNTLGSEFNLYYLLCCLVSDGFVRKSRTERNRSKRHWT